MMKRSVSAFALLASVVAIFGGRLGANEFTITPIDRSKIHPNNGNNSMEDYSTNWSGYVSALGFTSTGTTSASNNKVTSVIGSWIVPTITHTSSTASDAYCAIWVGIDGYANSTVEQTGTTHYWAGNQQQNYAWFEMYPGGSYTIGNFPLHPGDHITASVTYPYKSGNTIYPNTFAITIENVTRGAIFSIPSAQYPPTGAIKYTYSSTAERSTAEWIVEAPYSNEILPLSDFGTVYFSNCSAIINGVSGVINHWADEEIAMDTRPGGTLEAQPSALGSNGSSFSVTWDNQGASH